MMNKAKAKRALSFLFSAVLVLSAVSCGSDAPKKESSSPPASVPSVSEASTVDTAASDQELYEFTILGNLVTELTDLDKAYFSKLEEAQNVKINVELPPASSYTERLQMMLASGEYADATLFPNHTDKMYVDACRDGVFVRLNEMLEDCPSIMAHTYDISWETLKIFGENGDDSIYSVPRTSIARADGFFVRQDWLDKVGGIDYKEGDTMTLDQMYEILTKFTQDDPDGNGIADTYGLGATGDEDGNIDVFFGSAFGLGGWGEYDGEVIDLRYSKTNDTYKRALAFSQKLWQEGLVDPDAPTIKSDMMTDRYKKGINGVRPEFAGWLTDYEQTMQEVVPEAKLSYIPALVEKEGDTYSAGSFNTGFWGEWAIAETAEKPERILQVFDYMLSDDYWPETNFGPKDIAWTEEGGVKTATDQYNQTLAGRQMLRRNDDPGFFVSLAQSPEDRERIEGLIDICVKQYVFSLDQGYRPAIADDPAFIDYQKNMKVQISKIIVGERPVDDWDSILEGWYQAGGETYVEQMRAYIKASQS